MAEPVDNKKQFTAEEIKSKLNSINSYMDANRPEILAGIQAANAERDAEQAQKDYKISLLKPSGAVAKASIPKVQNELVGNRYTGPNPKLLSGGLKPGSLDHINSLIEKSKIDAAQLSDPLATARLTSFDGSHRGYNFDRYYSHDKYSEGKDGLGFSIYRDNEGIYNKNTSFADEFGRMSSKWVGLAWQGGSGLFKNWGRFGAIGEEEDADKMAADLSAATSTKTGAGAWTVNFLANSAYTMGILAEIGVEAGIAGLLFPETGGASGVAFAARLGKNVKRMGDAMSTLTKVLKGADKARTFYTQAKGLATGAAKTLLPGTNTIDLMRLASKPNSAYNRLDDFAKMRKSFGAFYKDLREINAVTAESRLEAGFAKNEVLDKGLKAFYQKNNRYPTAEESYELNKAANDAASTAFLANAPAIFYSNRIVLGTALKGFRPIRNAMTKLGLDSNVYKVIRNFNKPLADGRIPLEVVSRGLRSSTKRVFTKEYLKSIPTRLAHPFSKDGAKQIFGGGYRFMNANLAEGLQESYQEAVQAGVEDYYLNSYFEHLYSDPHLSANRSLMASILGYGVGQQFNTQGLDVFAQGFLMGGLVGPVQNSIMRYGQRGLMVAKDKFNKTNSYAEYVTNEEKRLNEYVNAVNNVMQHRAKHAIWLDENVAKQRDLAAEYEQNQAQGNRVAAENNKDESLFSHVFTLSQAGKLDIWLDQLEDLRSLSDTELAEAFQEYEGDVTDENSKSYRERLESAINKSKSIKNRIDRINDEVENPYDPDIIDRDKSPEAYKAEKIGWETFEMAKRAAIFNEYTFERTVSRLDSLINNAAKNSPIGDVAGLEYSILYNNELELINYVSLLQNEIDALDTGDKAQKTLARKKETQLKSLMDLRDSMDFIREKKKLIELAKKAALDPKNASEESKNALEQLKKEAAAILKDMDIISTESARMHLLDRGLTEDEIANLERENERNRTYGSVLGESGQYTIDFEKAEQENVIAPDVIILEKYKDDLYAAYAKYVKNIADLKNVFPIQGGLERSFSDLVDFLELSDDARWLSQYANILSNPMAIHDMALRMKNAKSAVAERELELIKKGLEDYKNNILNVDDLLQKLMDIGVYFPKEFIKNFRNKKILPPYFLDIDTHKKIQPADPKFDAIIKLINQDELDKNIKYLNKPSRPAPPPAPSGSAPVVAPPPEDTEDDISETPANPEHNVLTPFNELGDSVKNKLRELHQKAISENGATDDIQEWMRDSAEAAQVIAGTYKDETPVVLSTSNAVSGAITVDNPRSFSTPTADLKPIFVANEKEGWKLTPDETGYTNINRPEKERTVVKRVSDLKGTKPEDNAYLKASQKRGNVIDGLFRWFIEPHQNPSTNKPELSLKDQIINRILAGASAAQIKQEIETVIRSQGEYLSNKEKIKLTDSFYSDMAEVLYEMTNRYQSFNWHINLPTMVGTLNNEQYGGTIDLLLEKGGKYYIIDFKSSAKRRAGNDVYEEGDLIQQNAYADLFEQITGKKISKLYILNVKSKLSSDLKSVDSIELIKRTTVDRTGKKVTKILDEIPRIPIDTQFNSSKTPTSPAPTGPKGTIKVDGKIITMEGVPGSIDFTGNSKDTDFATMMPEITKMLKNWDKDFVNNNLVNYNGQFIFNHEGRVFVLVKVGNFIVPYYFSSSGTSGKAIDWHYVFGIDDVYGWIIKGGVDEKGEVVYSKQLRDLYPNAIAELERIKKEIRTKLAMTPETRDAVRTQLDQYNLGKTKYNKYLSSIYKGIDVVEKTTPDGIEVNDNYTYLLNATLGLIGLDKKTSAPTPATPAAAPVSSIEVISENYTPELLKANPNKLFLFGDNNTRTGKGGQAIIRDEPNAMGISTKLLPKNTPEAFMSDDQLADNKAVIDSDIKKAKDRAAKEGKTIVLPKGGFGTGLASLATKAPQTFAYLNQRLQEEFGFNNTTGELAASQKQGTESTQTPGGTPSEKLTLPIQNGTITIKAPSTDTYSEYWEFEVENGKIVSGTHRTYFQGEYRDRKTSDPITNLEEVYRKKSAVERYKITSEETTPKVDWNAVIDRATSAQEVDKIMDQIYAANASTPELIDRALVKKQSFKPAKTKVPSRFAGKLIWAQYGTVDPKIFEEYDVINADDVFNKVAAEMGIVANPNLSLAQTVELYRSSSDKSENAKANQIYAAVRNYIKELKSQGKTIVAYNWFLQQNADIISSPPKEKATFLNDAKTPEESIELFEKFITMYPARASAYDATQLKGWESIVNNTEKKTRSTVRELFEKGSLTSTPIDNIQNADVSIGYQGLIDILAAYLANPDVQNLYTITDIDNTLRVAPKETIIEMVKDKIKTFSQLLEKEPGNVEETKEALDTVDTLVSKYNPSAKPNEISSEDKSKASEIVANPLTDPSAAAQTFAEAANSTQEDVDNQFTKTLGC